VESQVILSPTRINRWVRCRRSYHWRYNRHLVRLTKSAPLSLGIIVSEVLAAYYGVDSEARSQEIIDTQLEVSTREAKPLSLGDSPRPKVIKEWEKVETVLPRLLSTYHQRAQSKDNFKVIQVETSQQVELAPNIHLLAIPDAIVEVDEDTLMVFEHKVRSRYHTGDFGIDFQSVASCMVSGSIGTLYNILRYSNMKYYRENIMRSGYELDYFKDMFIHIGEDILSTPPERLYPMPMKKCYCDYWELCMAEIQGVDVDDIISALYRNTHDKKDTEEEEVSNDTETD